MSKSLRQQTNGEYSAQNALVADLQPVLQEAMTAQLPTKAVITKAVPPRLVLSHRS